MEIIVNNINIHYEIIGNGKPIILFGIKENPMLCVGFKKAFSVE